jgi:hypothetical protein
LHEKQETLSLAYTGYSEPVDLGSLGADAFSVTASVDVDTPSAKTFDSGVASSLVVQDLTYTAAVRREAGDLSTIAYTGGATAGAEVVTVNGTAITVQIEDGVSTATQVKTAYDLVAAALALATVAVTGTGATAQVVAAATPLAGGEDSEVNTSTEEITIPAHGLNTGLKGQLTTTGTLPTGLSTGTDYFVIVVDENTIKLASTLANAIAGTAINLTSQGSSGAVNTFTPTALAGGGIKLQQTDADPSRFDLWTDVASATTITADTTVYLDKDRPTARWIRVAITLTAGNITTTLFALAKGDKAG